MLSYDTQELNLILIVVRVTKARTRTRYQEFEDNTYKTFEGE